MKLLMIIIQWNQNIWGEIKKIQNNSLAQLKLTGTNQGVGSKDLDIKYLNPKNNRKRPTMTLRPNSIKDTTYKNKITNSINI